MVNRAIVVAIQGYPELEPELKGPKGDARKFVDWVTTHGGVDPDPNKGHVKVILDEEPKAQSALDAKPRADAVQHEFDRLQEIGRKSPDGRAGDRLYLYLSGHGFGPDLSGVALLMANATADRTHNHIAPRHWADYFHALGLFNEVLLFLDCCRERYRPAPLIRPDTAAVPPDGARRFYGFAAKYGKLAVETPIDGEMSGVFTATLLDALNGDAAEEDGRITGESLKAYLYENMKGHLTAEQLALKEIAKEPDLLCDPPEKDFVIATVPQVRHEVAIPIPAGLEGAQRKLVGERAGNPFAVIAEAPGDGTGQWKLQLPRGTYQLIVDGAMKIVTLKGRGVIDVTDP